MEPDVLYRTDLGGEIRKITVSYGSNEFSVFVGQVLQKSGLKITCIERDEDSKFLFGSVHYVVKAKKVGSDKEFIWKNFHDFPTEIEFFAPSE